MRKAHALLVVTIVAAGLAATPGIAEAAPSGAPSASSVATFDCGDAGVYTGFANSGSSQALTWNPYFLTAADGSSWRLVPTANDLVVTVQGTVVFAPAATKGSTVGAVTCTVAGGSGAVSVGGSVSGGLVPAT